MLLLHNLRQKNKKQKILTT